MTDRERITEILKAYTKKHNISASSVILEEYAEELLANGIIVPPCKVGQTVYIIDEPDFADDFVLDVKVSEVGQDCRGMWIGLELPLGMRLSQYVSPNNLGNTVFLTKEEAEAELRKRSDQNAR